MTDLIALDTGDYYGTLSKQDKTRFEDAYKKNLRSIDIDSAREQAENIFSRRHIEHIRLVEDIASGFDPTQTSMSVGGFEFVATDPLCETSRSEADVLLLNDDYNYIYPCVIFCETEAEHVDQWVENVNDAHLIFSDEKNQARLKAQLDREGQDVGGIQYITLTRSTDARSIDFPNLAEKCEVEHYALWASNRWDQEIWHEDGSLVHKQLEGRLEAKLDSGLSNIEINYKIGSHPVLALRQVVFEIIESSDSDEEEPREFNRSMFKDHFESGLQILSRGSERNALIEGEADRLLESGIDIGILSDDPDRINSSRDFRIIFSGGTGPEDAKRATQEKYVETQADNRAKEIAFEKTEKNFEPKDSTDLADFQ